MSCSFRVSLFYVLLVTCRSAKVERANLDKVSDCCDKPFCDPNDQRYKKDGLEKEKPDRLAVDAAMFNPSKKGNEKLYVIYGARSFTFEFKDDVHYAPILKQSKKNDNLLNETFGAQLKKVKYAFSSDSNMLIRGEDDVIRAFETDETQSSTTEQIVQKNPWIKEQDGMEFYTGAHLKAHGETENGAFLAFYREPQTSPDSTLEPFDYIMILWDIDYMKILNGPIKHTGVLVAATGRRLSNGTNQSSRGLYFTKDGRVCEFDIPSSDTKDEHFKIEKGTYRLGETSFPACWHVRIYLGCPISYCYNGDVDDVAFSAYKKEQQFLLFREMYFYQVSVEDSKKLPMPAPSEKDAKGFIISDMEQLMENVDAAFNYFENNKSILIMIKDDMVKYYEDEELTFTPTDVLQRVFDGIPNDARVDTIVYDEELGGAIVLLGHEWGLFKRHPEEGRNMWKIDGDLRPQTEFNDMPAFVEGSFDFSGTIYFLYKGMYFTKRVGDEVAKPQYSAYSSVSSDKEQGIFYQSKETCGHWMQAGKEIFQTPEIVTAVGKRREVFEKMNYVRPKFVITKEAPVGHLTELLITIVATVAVVVFALFIGAVFLVHAKRKKRKKMRSRLMAKTESDRSELSDFKSNSRFKTKEVRGEKSQSSKGAKQVKSGGVKSKLDAVETKQ